MQTIAALILAIGVALGGLFVGFGFARGRAEDRFVEVKGLSEKPVKATLALWPLRFVVSANSLAEAQASASAATNEVLAFCRTCRSPTRKRRCTGRIGAARAS